MKLVSFALIATALLAAPAFAAQDARTVSLHRLERMAGWRVADDSCDGGGVCPAGQCYNSACPVNAPCTWPNRRANKANCHGSH
ncbi:MAG: hypothetical protein WDN03_03415 [Rhizomicrobium sp.]